MRIGKKIIDYIQPIDTNIDYGYDIVSSIDSQTHEDATNISTWDYLITNDKSSRDYNYLRDFAKAEFLPSWTSLTQDEKYILAKHLIYPASITQAEYDAIVPVGEQADNCAIVAKFTRIARERRWETARSKMSVLPVADSIDMYLSTEDISDRYMKANFPHLINWINSTAYAPFGIDYTTTGFSSKVYYTENFKNILNNIIINGNY
jgi:hypothetical protein